MINLLLVDGDADDLTSYQLGDLSRRTANAAADVEDFHARTQAHEEGEAVFIEVHGGEDGVVGCERGVVEVGAPAIEVG